MNDKTNNYLAAGLSIVVYILGFIFLFMKYTNRADYDAAAASLFSAAAFAIAISTKIANIRLKKIITYIIGGVTSLILLSLGLGSGSEALNCLIMFGFFSLGFFFLLRNYRNEERKEKERSKISKRKKMRTMMKMHIGK